MQKNKSIIVALTASLFAMPVQAIEVLNGWSGEGELGFSSTSGNTDSETLNAKLGLGKAHGNWKHNAKIAVLKASDSGVDSADSRVFTEKSEYRFAEHTYAFGRIKHEEDKFSGFDHQSVISFGIGHLFIETEIHKLEASAGIGYRDSEDDLGESNSEGVLDGEVKYQYVISPSATFNQNVQVESGDTNTYSKSETYLKLKINGNLNAKLGYEVKHNSDVPAGVDKTDTMTTVTLVYGF
jgi:putative salt-induced outer membrane protein